MATLLVFAVEASFGQSTNGQTHGQGFGNGNAGNPPGQQTATPGQLRLCLDQVVDQLTMDLGTVYRTQYSGPDQAVLYYTTGSLCSFKHIFITGDCTYFVINGSVSICN